MILPVHRLSICQAAIRAQSEREENISRLVSIFPTYKSDVLNNIRNIEIKTFGIKWCISYALSGNTWQDIKKLLKEK